MSNFIATQPKPNHYIITLKHSSGQLYQSAVEICRLSDIQEILKYGECQIIMTWEEGEIKCVKNNWFEALLEIREQLWELELLPLCYGASRNVILTGMAADMGSGLQVYKAQLGKKLEMENLVNIFTDGEDVEPVSVAVQREFKYEYWQSVEANAARLIAKLEQARKRRSP